MTNITSLFCSFLVLEKAVVTLAFVTDILVLERYYPKRGAPRSFPMTSRGGVDSAEIIGKNGWITHFLGILNQDISPWCVCK